MIVDLGNERHGDSIRKAVCVVGTGIGGGSFVLGQDRRKGDLAVVEAGDLQESLEVSSESVGRNFRLPKTREISLGGTGNLWRGLSSPLDPIDFMRRDWLEGSGWPIRREDLNPYYQTAGRLLGLPSLSRIERRITSPEIDERAHALDFDRSVLRNKHFVFSRPARSLRQELVRRFASSDDMLLLNATAVELVTNAEGDAVERLVVKEPGGDSIEIHARLFVLAAGALEPPRLLLNSQRHDERGVGNNRGMVGRYLMDHPMGVLGQIRLDRMRHAPLYQGVRVSPGRHVRSGLALREELQRLHRLPNHCLHLWPSLRRGVDERLDRLRLKLVAGGASSLTAGELSALLTSFNALYRVFSHVLPIGAWYKYADLFFVTEQTPAAASSVKLSRIKDRFVYPIAQIAWSISP